jgi:hypothetical protein
MGGRAPRPGFSLHANLALPAHARQQLEHLCRYLPALRGRCRIVAVYPGGPRLRDLLDRLGLSPLRTAPAAPEGPCSRHRPVTERRHSRADPPHPGLRPSLARSPAQPRLPGRADAPRPRSLPPRPLAPPQFGPVGRLRGPMGPLPSRLWRRGRGNEVKVGARHARGALSADGGIALGDPHAKGQPAPCRSLAPVRPRRRRQAGERRRRDRGRSLSVRGSWRAGCRSPMIT